MAFQKGIYQLQGFFQHYTWGGKQFISSITGFDNVEKRPLAEYWLGAHPLGVARVIDGNKNIGLDKLIESDPAKYLGKQVADQFGRLPYLLKILDVSDMLSIQVHPSKTAAEKEFERESLQGIPLDSPKRNYKDDNHKPELMVALGEFWLLHGFKPEDKLLEMLSHVDELKPLSQRFEKDGYRGLYKNVMEMDQAEVNKMLQPLLDRVIPLYNTNVLERSSADFWAARAALTFSVSGDIDRGIFSIYLFNLVHLKRGEAIFQDAGVPHAYLEGQNVEIMANSDNVLRGGLTNKNIDVPELLKHVKCEPTIPNILTGENINEHEKVYRTPAPDFELSVAQLKENEEVFRLADTTEILLLTAGRAIISNGNETELAIGTPAAVVFAGVNEKIVSRATDTTVFRASVPIQKR
jgi:mannose-6-phosphate isomerase